MSLISCQISLKHGYNRIGTNSLSKKLSKLMRGRSNAEWHVVGMHQLD